MSDCCATKGLMPVDDAIELILSHIAPVLETELMPLEQCNGRITAAPLCSAINVPQYDNSAMDGYALRFADAQNNQPLTVIGNSFAGSPFDGELNPGECVRIMTGAMLPAGADTVLKQEDVISSGKTIQLTRQPKLAESIRRTGEDIAAGTEVVAKGTRLTAFHIGMLAATGHHQIAVIRRLNVALMSTGDELSEPGNALASDQIYDCNRPAIRALLNSNAVNIIDLGIILDGKQQLQEALMQGSKVADVVISSGGVSVGDADYTKEVLEESGEIFLWKVAIKPGKPLVFGKLSDSLFFGLPGNPVSAVVTLQQIVGRALDKLCGVAKKPKFRLSAMTTEPVKKSAGRTDFQRGRFWQDEKGDLLVSPAKHQGSGIFSSLMNANCYIVLPQQMENLSPGQRVTIEPFANI